MSPDATQNPAEPHFIVCSGVPDIDQDDRSQSPMDCESNNASGPECVRLDGNDADWCGKREVSEDLDLDATSNYGSNSAYDEHSLKEGTNDPLLNGVNHDSAKEQPSVQLRSVLVPVRDPETKQIKHELVPIEIMDETGLNIIKSVLIPVRDPNGAVCYEVKKVLVPIIPDLTLQDISLTDQNKCPYCQEVYDTLELLKKHIHTFHELSYRCVHCHQTYSKAGYKIHMRTHEVDTYVECPVCQQRYTRMHGLKRHQTRVHSNIEPKFICDHCDKRFKLKSDLALHIDRTHMIVLRACKFCGKCFTTKNTLKVHELIHSGLRPYICDICGQSFTQRSSMMVHRRKHPGNHPPPPRVNLVNIQKR